MSEVIAETGSGIAVSTARRASLSFFGYMAAFMLLLVLIGFSPTFYLRDQIDLPFRFPINGLHVYVHGALMTAWFVLLLVQTVLVGTRRTTWHRKLGWVGAGLAAAVVVTILATELGRLIPPGPSPAGAPPPLPPNVFTANMSAAFLGNLGFVVTFAVLVVAAILRRHRPEVHKRLMLIATIAVIAPAISRWVFTFVLLGFELPTALMMSGLLRDYFSWVLIAAVVIHDLLTKRRVLLATALGSALAISLPILGGLIARTGLVQSWVGSVIYRGG